jgi:photosystem II stability/assembly factor-like uncharacterized protein
MKKIVFLFIVILFIHVRLHSQLYIEQNSGVTVSLNSICMAPFNYPERVWAAGDSGIVLLTTNGGENWLNRGNTAIPVSVNLVNVNSFSLDTAIVSGSGGTNTYAYRTTNLGLNWIQVFTQPNGSINGVWLKDALNGFMCGDPVGGRWSLWKTTNGGLNWDSAGLYLQQAGIEKGWNNSLQVIRNNIWFGTNNSRIYYSSNYGANWSVISTAPEVNSASLWFYSIDSTKGCFGGGNFYGTTNLGANWTNYFCAGTGDFKGFCFGPIGAFEDDPWGPCFTAREGNSGIFMTYQIFSNYITDYTAPNGTYNHVAYNNFYSGYWVGNVSYAVRNNGGITRFFTGRGGAISIISSEVPGGFSLSQNYPNPFNPVTKITFTISGSSVAQTFLSVYDALGREVSGLVNHQMQPGTYEVSWDASAYPSGIYYYRLESGNFTETKKMVLIK